METTTKTQDNGKTIAIIAYITIIGLIAAFIMNNDKKLPLASYHIKQSLGLALMCIPLWLINIIPILGWIISFLSLFVILYMWIMGLINAINEREKPMPIMGTKFEEWFKNI